MDKLLINLCLMTSMPIYISNGMFIEASKPKALQQGPLNDDDYDTTTFDPFGEDSIIIYDDNDSTEINYTSDDCVEPAVKSDAEDSPNAINIIQAGVDDDLESNPKNIYMDYPPRDIIKNDSIDYGQPHGRPKKNKNIIKIVQTNVDTSLFESNPQLYLDYPPRNIIKNNTDFANYDQPFNPNKIKNGGDSFFQIDESEQDGYREVDNYGYDQPDFYLRGCKEAKRCKKACNRVHKTLCKEFNCKKIKSIFKRMCQDKCEDAFADGDGDDNKETNSEDYYDDGYD